MGITQYIWPHPRLGKQLRLLSIQQDVQSKLVAAAEQPRKASARSLDLWMPVESAQQP